MSILESVAQGLGVGINKQFQVYDQEGNHVAAAVFKLDRNGWQLLATPKSEACIDPDAVLGGLITGNLIPQTKKLEPCPFCGSYAVHAQRMRLTPGDYKKARIGYIVYCPNCQAHGPLKPTQEEAINGWNLEFVE